MATITVLTTADLDVVNKQRELTTEALGADGVYIRMKETLQAMLEDGSISGTDKATAMSQAVVGMTNSITANAMSTALQWAAKEKETELAIAELGYKLALLEQQALLAENQVAESLAGRQFKQAQIIREYGIPTKDANGNVVALADNGKEYATIRNIDQDTANKVLMSDQITAQTEEVMARTHRTIADTYVNHGMFTGYTITSTGITGTSKLPTGYVTLSELNKQVAAQQAKGYTYNAWSNAATSSSGMIGTLIAAEIADLDPTTYLNVWQTAVSKLNGLTEPNISI